MQPPRHHRRGHSRRTQYGLFAGYVAAVAGITACLALLLVQRFDPLAFEALRGAALDLTAPAQSPARVLARGADDVLTEASDYIDAARARRGLETELAESRRALVRARQLAFENVRLRRLARLVDATPATVASARLVGSTPAGARRLAVLAAGSADGVRAGQPVQAPEGLVGRVFETGRHAARVLLLTDEGSTVPVRVVRTGAPALVLGRGDGGLDVRAPIAAGQSFRPGDLLVSSGTGGVFAPGVPVAVVTAPHGERADALPLADPARLDVAVVMQPFATPPPLAPPSGKRGR